jgi:hypothetical protein
LKKKEKKEKEILKMLYFFDKYELGYTKSILKMLSTNQSSKPSLTNQLWQSETSHQSV